MQEYTTYSVISPESCASILWSDSSLAEKASEKLKMLPNDLKKLGVIDGIIREPKGGAHRNREEAFTLMRAALDENLVFTSGKPVERLAKYRSIGNKALGKTSG